MREKKPFFNILNTEDSETETQLIPPGINLPHCKDSFIILVLTVNHEKQLNNII